MNSRRLTRLMGIICEIKAHPHRDPEEMCRRLGISRRQFYKDREALAEMGFNFHFSRKGEGFRLDKELVFNFSGLSLADLFALILGARELAALNQPAMVLAALSGLRGLVAQLPEPVRTPFAEALEEVVIREGLDCEPEVLEPLPPAIDEGRRVVLVMDQASGGQRLTVDPKRLFLRQGRLYLEAGGLEGDEVGVVALKRVSRVIPTPFYSPSEG